MVTISERLARMSEKRLPNSLFGSWEVGLTIFMLILYAVGTYINPRFFGSSDALLAILRESSRFGIIAVGMSFVIVNRDLDLSVGSTVGLSAIVFSMIFAPTHFDLGPGTAIAICVVLGVAIGLINGVLVTWLQVPAFIATLAMLFIGRGLVLGLTGGKNIGYSVKAQDFAIFGLGEDNGLGFNNQIIVFAIVAILGALVLGKTRWGYETYATGGNALAAEYAGIRTNKVRIRAFVISSICATLAGILNVLQDKAVTSQYGQGVELIAIAAVIVGGASIFGGRGRVLGSCLGAILVVIIDKVLREGVPITRTIDIDGVEMKINAMAQLPPGAVPAFIGLILLLAVLIEPVVLRRNLIGRTWARLRGRPLPPKPDLGGVAIIGVQTRGPRVTPRSFEPGFFGRLALRRNTAAVMLAALLWLVGLWLRPDFWASIDNTFNLMLAFTEVAILAIGVTFVIANGDIDLSVGSVLALSGATAAFMMKNLGADPVVAVTVAFAAGTLAGMINGMLVVRFGLPAFVATLGMFYMARGIGAWLVAGRQLSGFPDGFNLTGRKLIELLRYWDIAPTSGLVFDIAAALSVQTLIMVVIAVIAGVVIAFTPIGLMLLAVGGNRRAAEYAGINTSRTRFWSLVFSAMCASLAGIIYIAYFRSFNPSAGQLRELDAIAAVIIGGGSIFGGYASIIGSIAGAVVIALIRALLSLQIIPGDGPAFVMPQHWVNVLLGLILIMAVLADIWFRQNRILSSVKDRLRGRRQVAEVPDG